MISTLNVYREKNPEICFLPYHNLAVEKYLTFHVQGGQCILYLWQNRHTVVIGKNQNAWKECRISELKKDGGYLARRLSGGGAVYHDSGNLNFSFCIRKEDYNVPRQLEVILRAVKSLGIPAEKTGRNDLTMEGRKFSGNAFFESGVFCCHHGTIMLDVDREKLSRFLQVDPEKLKGKGVESVRSRVINLKDCCPSLSPELLRERLIQAFSEVYGLPAAELPASFFCEEANNEIQRDTAFFASDEWLLERRMPFTHRLAARYSWGETEILLQVNHGLVEDCICHSDAMDPDFAQILVRSFKGCRYDMNELKEAVGRCGEADRICPQMVLDIQQLLEREV